jgi:hypothetical protein
LVLVLLAYQSGKWSSFLAYKFDSFHQDRLVVIELSSASKSKDSVQVGDFSIADRHRNKPQIEIVELVLV